MQTILYQNYAFSDNPYVTHSSLMTSQKCGDLWYIFGKLYVKYNELFFFFLLLG